MNITAFFSDKAIVRPKCFWTILLWIAFSHLAGFGYISPSELSLYLYINWSLSFWHVYQFPYIIWFHRGIDFISSSIAIFPSGLDMASLTDVYATFFVLLYRIVQPATCHLMYTCLIYKHSSYITYYACRWARTFFPIAWLLTCNRAIIIFNWTNFSHNNQL